MAKIQPITLPKHPWHCIVISNHIKPIFDVSDSKNALFAPFLSHIYIYNKIKTKKIRTFVLSNGLKTN